MDGLLDESRLDGVYDIRTAVRPSRLAELVVAGDEQAFVERIRFHCQVWGGTGTVLVPSSDGRVPALYERPLMVSDVDGLDGRQTLGSGSDFAPPRWLGPGYDSPHPALLIADNLQRDDWFPFAVPQLSDDDPWRLIYAAMLGDLPLKPDADLFPKFRYPASPTFEQFFTVDRSEVSGSLDDLLCRLMERREFNTPRDLGSMHLASGLRLNTGYFGASDVIPDAGAVRAAAGPNIVVVFGSSPVADAALLWNLRHAHGVAGGLPIGVPEIEAASSKNRLIEPGVATQFGFAGGRIFVTSASLSVDEVEEALGEVIDERFFVVPPEDLITFGYAPSVPRDHVATFSAGRALVAPPGVEVVRDLHRHGDSPSLHVSVQVHGATVPLSKALRGDGSGPAFGAGRLHMSMQSERLRRTGSVQVEWPSSWLRLRAVARDHGLGVEVSQAGHASVSLLRAVGGFEGVPWLAHPAVVQLLYRLGERSGMTWWKNRWTETRKQLSNLTDDEFEAAAMAAGRDEPAVAPSGDGRQIRFHEFVVALGNKQKAAANWVRWAEARKLIVRGANIRCNHCAAGFWLPIAGTPPEIGCPGCGSTVDHPFPPEQLQFTYGLGEVVRRVLEVDALDHLFTAHYMWRQFKDRGLVGVHPGVDFREVESRDVVAEADVLMLMHDGALIPGEVKRTAAGLGGDAVAKLQATEQRLESPWSFFSVGQAARDCIGDVHGSVTRDGDRPRFLLSSDQTYDPSPRWSMGQNPFEWQPMSNEDDMARGVRFVDRLRERSPDDPWSWQETTFLNPEPDPR